MLPDEAPKRPFCLSCILTLPNELAVLLIQKGINFIWRLLRWIFLNKH